jgi:hypothetical protein
MRFLEKAVHVADAVNLYFADAITVFAGTNDPVVRLAALTAAKVAAGAQRASMVNFLRIVAANIREATRDEDAPYRLNQLADEIASRDWTLRDIRNSKLALRGLDATYAEALNRADSSVFRRRFPHLFAGGPEPTHFFFAALTSYLLFEDAPAGAAALLAILQADDQARATMLGALMVMTEASDSLMLLLLTADGSSDSIIRRMPLAQVAKQVRQRATVLCERADEFANDVDAARAQLIADAPRYEEALRDNNARVFTKLDWEGLEMLNKFFS